ncbi:MAG: Peptidoglycan-binding protein [Patescibacteria group bacterium]|nr:Peptidoglycan-binding protein [Patescibacteria group bacterium]
MSKKLIALTLAVAFALPFVAPAQAATVEELQALINSLNQQIAALQQQLAGLTGSSATTGTYCFTTDLKQGMTSNDVKNKQIV